MKCSKCGGATEKISRAGVEIFYHCRACKLPHDPLGNPLFTSKSLSQRYNPLQAARDAIKRSHGPSVAPVTRTALEVALLQTVQEAYFAGMKDGVLLAYSQDVEEGEPMMEKVGVSNEELKTELRDKYTSLVAERVRLEKDGLQKEASARVEAELAAVKIKLDELESL